MDLRKLRERLYFDIKACNRGLQQAYGNATIKIDNRGSNFFVTVTVDDKDIAAYDFDGLDVTEFLAQQTELWQEVVGVVCELAAKRQNEITRAERSIKTRQGGGSTDSHRRARGMV